MTLDLLSVTINSDWISTDISAGTGDGELKLAVETNQFNMSRSGILTITGGLDFVSVFVNQDPGELVSVGEPLESEVLIFPNPTHENINLTNLSSGITNATVEIININGQRLFKKSYQITGGNLIIASDILDSGIYFLNVKFMDQRGLIFNEFTRKVIKN